MDSTGNGLDRALRYLSLGLEIAAAFALPILAGFWLDNRFDASPWFVLAGCVVGILLFISISIRLASNRDSV